MMKFRSDDKNLEQQLNSSEKHLENSGETFEKISLNTMEKTGDTSKLKKREKNEKLDVHITLDDAMGDNSNKVKRKGKPVGFPIITLLLFITAVLVACNAIYKGYYELCAYGLDVLNPTETINMPDFVGMDIDEIGDLAKDFNVNLVEEYNKDTANNEIHSQSPKADTPVKPGQNITLKYSTGSSTVKTPDLTGLSLDERRQALVDLGLKPVVVLQTPDIPLRDYNAQSNKSNFNYKLINAPLEKYYTIGEEVPLYVERPNVAKSRIVPDIIGKSKSEASAMLSQAGIFQGGFNTEASTLPAGTVIYAWPRVGTEISWDEPVWVRVSGGPTYVPQ